MRHNRRGIDSYDDHPRMMRRYLRDNGYHFNKELYEYAVSYMYKESDGKKEYMNPIDKSKVKELMTKYNITLKNDCMYDSCYVFSMAVSDFYGNDKSLPNEEALAKYIKEMIDDTDKPEGYIMNRWYADMCFSGVVIDWEEFI